MSCVMNIYTYFIFERYINLFQEFQGYKHNYYTFHLYKYKSFSPVPNIFELVITKFKITVSLSTRLRWT